MLNDARYRTSVVAVKDSFYVVPIGVEDECGVVPGVIVRSQPGPSVVDSSRLDGCGVEPINRFAVLVLSEERGALIRESAPPQQ